ncbi:MAG: peptidylprolyl isomerase [Clostridia bacterium]|nr:peptidylprolyl isomerase [Clostridia bacterium]
MTMENGDIVKMELYPNIAPETVKNFITLANSGFYNGLIFHRVIPSFMAQGGDPDGNGTGGPGYSIKGEFKLNGVENNLTHDIGVVSMARSTEYDSAGSQFFIVTDDEYSKESLDGQYAGFGKVIEGMEHVFTIVNSEVIRRDVDAEVVNKVNNEFYTTGKVSEETYAEYYAQMMEVDRPKNPPVIKTITVETFGVEYGSPVKY